MANDRVLAVAVFWIAYIYICMYVCMYVCTYGDLDACFAPPIHMIYIIIVYIYNVVIDRYNTDSQLNLNHDIMDNQSSCCCRKKRYRASCVRSKDAVLILILCFFVFSMATNLIQLVGKLGRNSIYQDFRIPLIFGLFAIVSLSFSFLGLIGEKCMRYKVIIIGYLILSISYIFLILSEVVILLIRIFKSQYFITKPHLIIITVTAVFTFLGLCLFVANIIQFGTDQLQFAPSEELSSFVYWFVWVYALSNLFYSLYEYIIIIATISESTSNTLVETVTSILPFITCILFILIGSLFFCCFKHHLVIEPSQHNNPVKLIWRVIKYAWKHKQPVRRSAFTYGEPPPSRLDLGKERYGGPFTTDQVESVKSFWSILPIILGTIVVSFVESNLHQPNDIVSPMNSTFYSEYLFFNYPAIIPYGVVVIVIPIHQLLIVPYFSHYIPSMLKRIWIGLVLVLVHLVLLTISFSMKSLCVYIISRFLEGRSIMLVYTGSLELILAQAPRTMQGILIGLWLMQYCFLWNLNELILSYLDCNQLLLVIYSGVITCLALIPIIIYTIAAYRYKYRQHNELSDVNERIIITQYTEKQLDQEELLHRDEVGISYCIESMAVD